MYVYVGINVLTELVHFQQILYLLGVNKHYGDVVLWEQSIKYFEQSRELDKMLLICFSIILKQLINSTTDQCVKHVLADKFNNVIEKFTTCV